MFSKLIERTGKSPILRASLLRSGTVLEKFHKGQNVPKVLKFIVISFPMFWLFVIIAETKMVLFSFKVFHLLELKLKDVVSLGDSSRV